MIECNYDKRFELQRSTVIANLLKSNNNGMRFLAENLKNSSTEEVKRYKHNYPEIWKEFLVSSKDIK